MWNKAIHAIQNDELQWIQKHHLEFKKFFLESNEKPLGKLNDDSKTAHYQHKIFKMYVGLNYGGLGLPLHEGARWIENAAQLDGNWGWLLGIGVGGAYFVDYMEPATAQRFFTPEEALVAGSGMPNSKATKKGSQWEIEGSWRFCSGCEQANMFTAVAEKEGKMLALVMNPDQAEIIPTWNTSGMNLTCSHTIKAESAVIDDNQFFDLTAPPRPSNYPLSKYPFMQFAQVCFAPVIAGISHSIFIEAKKILQQKKQAWESRQPERVKYVSHAVDQFFEHYDQHREFFYNTLENSWNALIEYKVIKKEKVEKAALSWASECYTAVAQVIPYLGMTVIENSHPIQKMWQNLQVGYQHSSLRKYNYL